MNLDIFDLKEDQLFTALSNMMAWDRVKLTYEQKITLITNTLKYIDINYYRTRMTPYELKLINHKPTCETLLHAAVRGVDVEWVKILLEHGASPTGGKCYLNPLELAQLHSVETKWGRKANESQELKDIIKLLSL